MYIYIYMMTDKLFPCHNNMALPGLSKNVYLPKLYLPQMASLDVQRETYGAKGRMGVAPPQLGPYLIE